MVWQPRKGVSIKEVKSGLFLFHFFHKIDFNNILEGRPWFFDNHTLILGRIKVHSLPMGFMIEEVGRNLGKQVGYFLEVLVDVRKTLLKEKMIK
ncbi:hypothetical protein JHK82_044898 [Glycine max]|nr:hypothetical protein JHK82_044898 [Glycine max]